MVTNAVINIVTNKEVPGTNLVGIPIKYIIAGTIRNAPPTPIIAAIKPTTKPRAIGTNALLENKGSKTALVITEGFGDILKIGFQNRPNLFDINIFTKGVN